MDGELKAIFLLLAGILAFVFVGSMFMAATGCCKCDPKFGDCR